LGSLFVDYKFINLQKNAGYRKTLKINKFKHTKIHCKFIQTIFFWKFYTAPAEEKTDSYLWPNKSVAQGTTKAKQ